MRRIIAAAFVLVAACGGGGGGPKDTYDPVTHVALTDTTYGGRAEWGPAGSSIVIWEGTAPHFRLLTLCHEIWHIATQHEGHPNGCGCVSYEDIACPFDPPPLVPCPAEVEQFLVTGRVVTISFPEDPACAEAAAAFWNTAAGVEMVMVVH